jgi:hypothetical protein
MICVEVELRGSSSIFIMIYKAGYHSYQVDVHRALTVCRLKLGSIIFISISKHHGGCYFNIEWVESIRLGDASIIEDSYCSTR